MHRSEPDRECRTKTKTENSLVYNMRLKSRDIISLLFFVCEGVVSWERVDIFVILSFVATTLITS